MRALTELIASHEDWLCERVTHYAKDQNCAKYTTIFTEARHSSIRELSKSIIKALQKEGRGVKLSERDGRKIAKFITPYVKKHRALGVPLKSFIALFRNYKRSYMDLIRISNFKKNDEKKFADFLERFFKALESEFSAEWGNITEERLLKESEEERNILVNEKNKYLSILINSPNPIMLLDARNRIDAINDAAVEILSGKVVSAKRSSRREWAGKTPKTLIKEIEKFVKSKKESISTEIEMTVHREARNFQANFKKIRGMKDEFKGTLLILNDITGQKRVERALKESEGQFRTLVNSMDDFVYTLDMEQRVTGFFGREYSERKNEIKRFLGKKPREIFGEEKGIVHEVANMMATISSNVTYDWDVDIDGKKRYYQTALSPLYDSEKRVIGLVGVGRNISDLKETERALKESEEKYRTLIETAPDAIFSIEAKRGIILTANKKAEELTGWASKEIIGANHLDLYPESDRRAMERYFDDYLREKRGGFTNAAVRHTGNILIPVEIRLSLVEGKSGDVVIAILRDISERIKAEAEAQRLKRESEAFLSGMSEQAKYLDKQMRVMWANDAVYRATGLKKEELLGNYCYKAIYGVNSTCDGCPVKRAFETGMLEVGEVETADGKSWLNRANPITDAKGLLIGVATVSLDITEKKESERQIEKYQQKLKSLVSQLSIAEDTERKRIATEIHESIAQLLAISKIKLNALKKSKKSERLDEAIALIDKAILATRTIMVEITPPILYALDFKAAIEWLVEQFNNKSNISIAFESNAQTVNLENETKTILFKATRELLTNVVKHSKASRAKVSLMKTNEHLMLIVEDNGVSFDADNFNIYPGKENGFGLFNIKEWMDHFGGKMTIESEKKKGTIITLIIKA
ncbi:MAG: hypothetical protein Kow0090_09290 [Myxococcota bacterium]